LALFRLPDNTDAGCGPLAGPRWSATTTTIRGKMVHKFLDRADEQSKEAELVWLRTSPRTIWIDWMTGEICAPEPIEHGGQVIPFTAPRSGLRGKIK
jgi:hypothetical protein